MRLTYGLLFYINLNRLLWIPPFEVVDWRPVALSKPPHTTPDFFWAYEQKDFTFWIFNFQLQRPLSKPMEA